MGQSATSGETLLENVWVRLSIILKCIILFFDSVHDFVFDRLITLVMCINFFFFF